MKIQSNHVVTYEAKDAFYNHSSYVKGITIISVDIHKVYYKFYGHKIATLDKETGDLYVQTKHIKDVAFRNRLNSLDNVNVTRSNGKYYLNGLKWDGSKAKVFKGFEYMYQERTKNKDTVQISWHVDDVLGLDSAKENNLTKDEARDVLSMADRRHDACEGINWDTLNFLINIVVQDRI